MKKLLPFLFWMVTWQQQTTKYDDCSWVSKGGITLSVMCYPGCSLIEEKHSEEYQDLALAKERVAELKRDRNASDVRVFEYREVK